jgi:DUF4097 and DUF4098 domain-containing protein YvlB
LAAVTLSAAAQEQKDEKIQRSFAANAGSTLRVENYKGTIHISSSDTSQVTIDAVKRFNGSESDRKFWMENTKIEFDNSGNTVAVNVRYPTTTWNCWLCWQDHDYVAEVDLEIQVPRRINVELNGYKPDIRISSVQGNIRVKSYKAPMTIESTTGPIYIDTYKNTIRLKNVAIHGGLEVKSYKADAQIEARALDGASRLENYRGTIILKVPGDIGLNVDFSGDRRGSFHTDLPLAAQTSGRRDSSVRGTINRGGTPLVLRTSRGSISVEKLAGDL